MVTTNSFQLTQKLRKLKNHGMIRLNYKYPFLGYNYCPTNIAGALGLTQLKKLDNLNAKRLKNAKYFIRSQYVLGFLGVAFMMKFQMN